MIGTPAEHQKALIDRLQGENAELRDDLMGAVERALGSEALANWRRDKIEELTDILDAAEAANARHLARIDQLEQLCRDMYEDMSAAAKPTAEPEYFAIDTKIHDRMEQLGLIHETEYDPDTGLKWGEQQ